jgi:2-polyprenyl-3-methyl-5-hydroxy-6-metoxy-1,4-benzoquinol methylase
MSVLIHHSICPACSSSSIKLIFSAVDYTVSNEAFYIWHCNNCSLQFTQDVPDLNNIAPYYQSNSYVSHSDTKEGLTNKLYHLVRTYTLKQKYKLIKNSTKLAKGKLLDIGAGTGAFANTMQKNGWEVIGLEPDATAREQAIKNYQLQLDLPDNISHFEPASFNVITLWHVLEHVHDLKGYWSHFKKLLSNQGQLIIAVPNYTSQDAKHYGQYWAAYDVPRHLYHFSPQSIELLAIQFGFTLKSIQPMWFDSFYVSMLSEQYKNGKSNLLKAFWNGLLSNCNAIFNKRKCSSVIYVFTKND